MNLTVYVPKDLEPRLRRCAKRLKTTPCRYVQAVVRQALEAEPARFTAEFASLAGTWEDTRSADEIVADIEASRRSASRMRLR